MMGTGMIRLGPFAAHVSSLALLGSLALTSASAIIQAASAPAMAGIDKVATQGQDAMDLPLPVLMGAGALVGGLLVRVALHKSGSEGHRDAR